MLRPSHDYSQRTRCVVLMLLAPVFLVALPALFIGLGAWLDHRMRLPAALPSPANLIVGIPLILVGGGLGLWSNYRLVTAGRGTPLPLMPTQQLIVEAPYTLSRNPMALGAIGLYLGVATLVRSIGAVLVVLLCAAALLTYIRFGEERETTARFGSDYLAYRRRTPFLIPRSRPDDESDDAAPVRQATPVQPGSGQPGPRDRASGPSAEQALRRSFGDMSGGRAAERRVWADQVSAVPGSLGPRPRTAYLDNLKVVLVALVILGHAFITYGDLGSWVYREQSGNDAFIAVAAVVVSLGSLFAMGLFFLIAGLLTPGPLRRKGRAGFLRDRGIRLGVPFLAYLLLVYPLAMWAGEQDRPASAYLRDAWTDLDPGPLWFVGVLLLFTVIYVAWRAVRPAPPGPHRPLHPAHLLGLGVAIAVGTALVRVRFAMDSGQPFSAHVWQWPQCGGLFVLGLASAEHGWLAPVAPGLRRGGGWAALSGAVVLMGAIATAENSDAFVGGVTWQALLTAALEGVISVGLSVWLLGTFQRRYDRSGPLARALGRAAFGAYVLQAPVLLAFALLAHPLPVPPEVKFLLVAPAGITGSFALAWLLTRIPGVRRVL